MKRFIVVLTAIVIVAICWTYISVGYANDKTRDRQLDRTTRSVGDFSEIVVSNGINLNITSDVSDVVVETPTGQQSVVKTELSNGVLRLSLDRSSVWKRRRLPVTVSVPMGAYSSITTGSGSLICLGNGFKTDNLQIKVSSGSVVRGMVTCANLSLNVSSGSAITLKGECSVLSVGASSGSSCSCLELNAQKADCKASSGSSIKLNVAKELALNVSSGSSVKYVGDCVITSIKQSSGASVSKM